MTDDKVQALLDRLLDPMITWALPRMPRWLALIIFVPVAAIIGAVIGLLGSFRPWPLKVTMASGKAVTIGWNQYSTWPSGIDAWETEIAKIRQDWARAEVERTRPPVCDRPSCYEGPNVVASRRNHGCVPDWNRQVKP